MYKLEGKKLTGISVASASCSIDFFLLIQQFYIVILSADLKQTEGSSMLQVNNNSSSSFGWNKLNCSTD